MFFTRDSPCEIPNCMNSDRAGREKITSRVHTYCYTAKWSVRRITANDIHKLHDELSTSSDGKSALAKDSFAGIAQKLDILIKFNKASAAGFAGLRKEFNDQASRFRELEEILLKISDKKKAFEKELAQYRLKSLSSTIDSLIQSGVSVNGIKLVFAKVPATSVDELKSLGDTLRSKLVSGVGVLASVIEEKVALVCVVTDDLVSAKRIEAGKVVGAVAKLLGGGGGGKPHLATAGGKDVAKLDEALKETETIVKSLLK